MTSYVVIDETGKEITDHSLMLKKNAELFASWKPNWKVKKVQRFQRGLK